MYLYFFFQLISPLFFPPPFSSPTSLPTPEVAGETPSWDLQKSFFNFPFDKRVKVLNPRHRVKLSVKAVGPLIAGHRQDLGSNATAFDVSGQLRLLNIRANMFIPSNPTPHPHCLPPRKIGRVWLIPSPYRSLPYDPNAYKHCILGKFLRGAL